MKKPSSSGAHAHARALVEARGLDPDAPLRALATIAPRWGSDPDLETAIVLLAGGADDASIGAELAALEERTASRAVKREIRRALFRLQQRGLWHPAAAPPPPSTAELLGKPDDGQEAWISPIDAIGMRAVWLARRAHDGVDSLTAFIGEEGVHETYSGATTRKALRKMLHDLSTERRLNLVETPWSHAHALLTQAIERTSDEAKATKARKELNAIAPEPQAAAPHPLERLLDRNAVASDAASLEASAQVLAERELAGWLLPREWIDAVLAHLDDAGSSMLVLSPIQQQERFRDAMGKAVEEVLDPPERRERYRERLEETAYLLARRGAMAPARSALAGAIALRSGRPILEIPLLAELTRRSLALALEIRAAQAKEESASSLVVTPQQALAEAQRQSQPRRR